MVVTFTRSLEKEYQRTRSLTPPKQKERLETLQKVKEADFYTGITFIPVLPFISDSAEQIEEMVKTAKEFGADYVFVGALTLYGIGKELYYKTLEKHFPELLSKYKQLFRILNQPSKEYRLRLEKKAKEFCGKYGIRYKIW